jgi:hypothetical protein
MKSILLYLILNIVSSLAWAAQYDPYLYPVVNTGINKKIFDPKHEINFHLDYSPSNVFYRLYGAGLSYSMKINSDFRWELISSSFFTMQASVLNKNMSNSGADLSLDVAKGPDYMFFSSAEYYPLYGKGFLKHQYFSLSRMGISAGIGQIFFSGFPANAIQVGLKGAMVFSASQAAVLEMNYARTFPEQKYFQSMLFFKLGWLTAF